MKTEEMVMYILHGLDSDMQPIPVKQMHIWLHVNFLREQQGEKPIDRLRFSKLMSRMKSKGKVLQKVWFSPCDGNVWILNKNLSPASLLSDG